jgi:hypothetical protein
MGCGHGQDPQKITLRLPPELLARAEEADITLTETLDDRLRKRGPSPRAADRDDAEGVRSGARMGGVWAANGPRAHYFTE